LFKTWLNQFALQEGFDYKVRTSEKEENIIRQVKYVCIKSGIYNFQATVNPTKRHNNVFQRTKYQWKLNITFLKPASE
ncbi:10990_t:CDS:1, partial [Racocetra persica]